ncbi:MAG: PAS domain-containing protein [Nitrospira sp.]|jgi:PAS domain S-box-containing protein|nr:PAS domain-containing protein [Nitrospira sp.]
MSSLSLPVRGELKMVPSIGGIAAAAVAVFVADWLTPLGVLVFILYVPLCLACLWMASERQAVFMAGFCSVLMILGLFLSPPGVPFVWGIFNRSLGLASLWGALWAGVTFGRRTEQLADALRQSEQEQKAIAERERTRAQQLKRLSEVSLALSGDPGDVFEQAVRAIGELFEVPVVCLSEIVGQELKFKAVYVKGQVFRDAGGCPMAITPCATVEVTKDLRVFDRVIERFPEASFLKDHQAYAYCGFPALDGEGHVVAVTCLLDDKPHAFTEDDQALLRAFGQRIAIEVERSRHLAERKQAEARLWQQERQLQALVTSLDDVVFEFDEYGTYLNVWTGNESLLFKPKGEILGRTIEEVLGRESGRPFMEMLARVSAGGTMEEVEYPLEVPGGRRWFEARTSLIASEDRRTNTVAMVVRDITDRKAAEDALRVSEERVRLALMASQQGIFDLDLRTGNAEVSNEYATMLGYDPATFKETNAQWAARMHPEDREKVYRIYEAYIRGENPTYEVEFRQRMKSGEWKWVLSIGSIVERDAEGRPLRMLGTHTDISERKEREMALCEADARLQEAQAMAKLGNWELDLVSNRLFWSDEIFQIFEIDQTKFAASYEGFLNAIHPDDRAMVNEAYSQSVQNRTAYMIMHRLLMRDGRVKHVMERGETFYDASGQPFRSVGTVQDITEQRLAELQVAQALQEKEMLLREIHHRVKNNLQLVSSLLYFQSKKVRSDEDLAVIRELQDRITSMILVHEKLYRSGDLAHIAFGDYVRALAESIGRSYERMRGKVEVLVDAQPVTLPVELALPAGLIVNELLTNAFKYAFPKDGSGEVRVQVLNGDGQVEIAVEDTGVGLPDGFELQTSATFGMQLMRGLAAQVGGAITFESGRGTAVRLTVPLPE